MRGCDNALVESVCVNANFRIIPRLVHRLGSDVPQVRVSARRPRKVIFSVSHVRSCFGKIRQWRGQRRTKKRRNDAVARRTRCMDGRLAGINCPVVCPNRPSTWSVVRLRPPYSGPSCCNQPPRSKNCNCNWVYSC